MTHQERAKQFMPYAALGKGLGAAMRDQELLSEREERRSFLEDGAEELNRKLTSVQLGDEVKITYYCRHRYVEISGTVKKYRPEQGFLIVEETRVPFRDLLDVEIV